jgi:hypothetical protein
MKIWKSYRLGFKKCPTQNFLLLAGTHATCARQKQT